VNLTDLENYNRVKSVVAEILANSNKGIVLLIDGDRTLIPVDSTKAFFQYSGLSFEKLKNIFQMFGYTYEAIL
jgi:hypothetical protein